MPTFDIVNKVNMEAFKNAIDGVNREIANRYDFKGSISKIFIENDNYYIFEFSLVGNNTNRQRGKIIKISEKMELPSKF